MSAIRILALSLALASAPAAAQDVTPVNPLVDYAGFLALTGEVAEYREARLLPWDAFASRARAEGAILLDSRSAEAFAAGHLEGAVNLPFSDFTAERLAQVIGPDAGRPIYIYCNNNFADDRPPVPLKRAPLALNIPTFINLVGYGYDNVWELGEVVRTDAPGIGWVAAAS